MHKDAVLRSVAPQTHEELLKSVVCAMCDFPKDVFFDIHNTEHSVSVDVHINVQDVSRVIGRDGTHAQALRTLFSSIYARQNKKLYLMVVNPNHQIAPRR